MMSGNQTLNWVGRNMEPNSNSSPENKARRVAIPAIPVTIAAEAASVSFHNCQRVDLTRLTYFFMIRFYHIPKQNGSEQDGVSAVQAFLGRRELS